MKKFIYSFILVFLSICMVFTVSSCKGINRGGGYLYEGSKDDDNYVKISISDTEYIHYLMREGVGEWVTDTGSLPISIRGIYYPERGSDAYRLTCYNNGNDTEVARSYLRLDETENIEYETFLIGRPDRKKDEISIMNETTQDLIYALKCETSYQENIVLSITSDQWKEFINYDDSTVYRSLEHSFWYSPSQDIGEWKVGDQIIPIKIELLPYGPGITIYDLSNGEKKIILVAAGALSDNNTLVLDCFKGEMFYNNSQTIESLALTKTN